MLLENRVAIVTGAGRGIGRAAAAALAREGARVMVCDKGTSVDTSADADPSVAGQAAKEIAAEAGVETLASDVDVTDDAAVSAMFDDAVAAWGHVDIVVNAAGIIRDRMLWNVPSEEWDDVTRVHLRSCYTTVSALARHARATRDEPRDRSVVTFSSSAGVFGNAGSTAYGTAKSGVLGFTRIAAMELGRYGVRVNAVVPFAWTRMAEVLPGQADEENERLARLRQLGPEHVANLVTWLAATADPQLTGQVLGMRGKELLVFSQPSIHSRVSLEETDPRSISEALGEQPGGNLPPLRPSGEIFDYDPIL